MASRTPATAAPAASGARVQIEADRPAALRTDAPASASRTPPQKTPHAPDTSWGRPRGDRGWSLRHVSRLTGINIADLSRIERGVSSPTMEQARKLIALYDGAR